MVYGSPVQRTNIYLDRRQIKALKLLAAEEHTTMAEIARRAIDGYVAERAEGDAIETKPRSSSGLSLERKRQLLNDLAGVWADDPSIAAIFEDIQRERDAGKTREISLD
jgi:hypothetical protein